MSLREKVTHSERILVKSYLEEPGNLVIDRRHNAEPRLPVPQPSASSPDLSSL